MKTFLDDFRLIKALGIISFLVTSVWAYYASAIEINFLAFSFFSLAFGVLLLSSFVGKFSQFFFVLNCFLFLGFWGKFVNYLLSGEKFPEINIAYDSSLFNEALWYSGGFACVVLLARYLCYLAMSWLPKRSDEKAEPLLGTSGTRYLSIGIFVLIMIAMILNSYLGILRVGLPAETKLPTVISLGFSWLMGPGSAFTYYLWNPALSFLNVTLIIIMMVSLSFSTLSRNSMMYFLFPLVMALIFKKLHVRQRIFYGLGVFGFLLLVIVGVSQFRWHFYFNEKSQISSLQQQPPILQIRDLLINRWVGIEGVLVGLSHVSDEIFLQMVLEKPGGIANSKYQNLAKTSWDNSKNLLFFSIPGPAGLILFAESWSYRVAAILCFILIIIFSFLVCEYLMPEGIAKSTLVWWTTQSVAQLSLFFGFNLAIFCCYLFMAMAMLIFYRLINRLNSRRVA